MVRSPGTVLAITVQSTSDQQLGLTITDRGTPPTSVRDPSAHYQFRPRLHVRSANPPRNVSATATTGLHEPQPRPGPGTVPDTDSNLRSTSDTAVAGQCSGSLHATTKLYPHYILPTLPAPIGSTS